MLVAWRDDGFWTLLWLAAWLTLTGGRKRDLPPRGFVGQISGSLAVIEPRHFKRWSTTLSRTRFTSPAPAWRLTCVWERSRLLSRGLRLGPSSVDAGVSAQEVDGVDSSGTRRVSSLTTLTWASRPRLTSHSSLLVSSRVVETLGGSFSHVGPEGSAHYPSCPPALAVSTLDHRVVELMPLQSLTLGK